MLNPSLSNRIWSIPKYETQCPHPLISCHHRPLQLQGRPWRGRCLPFLVDAPFPAGLTSHKSAPFLRSIIVVDAATRRKLLCCCSRDLLIHILKFSWLTASFCDIAPNDPSQNFDGMHPHISLILVIKNDPFWWLVPGGIRVSKQSFTLVEFAKSAYI